MKAFVEFLGNIIGIALMGIAAGLLALIAVKVWQLVFIW